MSIIKTVEIDMNENKIIVAYNIKLKIESKTLAYIIIVNNICNNNKITMESINPKPIILQYTTIITHQCKLQQKN